MLKKKNKITIRFSTTKYLTYVAAIGDSSDSMEMRYENGELT